MAAMSPEQQAFTIFQQEMAQTRTHVAQLLDSYEALKSALDALNLAAQQALAEKEQKIQESENRLRGLIFHRSTRRRSSRTTSVGALLSCSSLGSGSSRPFATPSAPASGTQNPAHGDP